jgi:hypothetical protein
VTALANGEPLTLLRVTVPWRGAPIVEARSQLEVTPVGGVVSFMCGDLPISAALLPGRAGMFAGGWSGFAVAGRGGWRKTLPAKGYRSPAGLVDAQIYGDAALESGEPPPLVAAPRVVGGFYVRAGSFLGQPCVASDVFSLLAPGQDWWVNPVGVAVVGTRLSGPVVAAFDLLENDPSAGRCVIATDAPAAFVPGLTFTDPQQGSFTINSVCWTSTAGKLRGEVWTA